LLTELACGKDTVEIGKYYNENEEYQHSGGQLKVALTGTDLVRTRYALLTA